MFLDYRRIVGFPDYIISNYGIVYSTKFGKVREMKPSYDKDGYKYVCLYKNGVRKMLTVHSLVGNAFVGKREGEMTFDHWPDRTRTNNRADNIRLATLLQQAHNKGIQKNNKLGEKHICTTFKPGYEYYAIQINRNKKIVFHKLLNKKKYTLEDAIKERDDFLLSI